MTPNFWPTLDKGTGQPTFIRADLRAMPVVQVRKIPDVRRRRDPRPTPPPPGVGRGTILSLLALAGLCALVVKWAR